MVSVLNVEQKLTESFKKGKVEIKADRCKGCKLCVQVCPRGVLMVSKKLNEMGYHPVESSGSDCTGCELCYTVCPEPGCITVYRE